MKIYKFGFLSLYLWVILIKFRVKLCILPTKNGKFKENMIPKIIKTYEETTQKYGYYADFGRYYEALDKVQNTYINGANLRDKFSSWLAFLNPQKLIYLGVITALKERNLDIFNNILYVGAHQFRCVVLACGYDHSAFAYQTLTTLLCSGDFEKIEQIYPKNLGLSVNGYPANVVITNLVMALYYKDLDFKNASLNQAEKFLIKKTLAGRKGHHTLALIAFTRRFKRL